MKAAVYTEFGGPEVLHLAERPKPVPQDDEVLVRVHAAPVTYGDLLARNFGNVSRREFNMPLPLLLAMRMYFGFSRPKVNILGSEFAGKIEAVGKRVTRFKAGDQVMGYLGQRMGAYAEYVCLAEKGALALKPANMTYVEAAAVPYGALMATSLLRYGRLQPGHEVLVNGASGGVGSAAVQLARQYGARVTGVCGAPRTEYVKAIGAYQVIDYAREDFTENGETYDLIFDVLGRSSFARCKRSLKPGGIYLPVSFKTKALLQMLWTKIAGGKRVICALAGETAESLVFVKGLIEAGEFRTLVDECFPLEQAADAHRYVEAGREKGKVVITVCDEPHEQNAPEHFS